MIALGKGFKTLLLLLLLLKWYIFGCNKLIDASPKIYTSGGDIYYAPRTFNFSFLYIFLWTYIVGFRVYCEHLYAMESRHSLFSCIHNAKYTLITAVQTYYMFDSRWIWTNILVKKWGSSIPVLVYEICNKGFGVLNGFKVYHCGIAVHRSRFTEYLSK